MNKALKQWICLILSVLAVLTLSAAAEEKDEVQTWLELARETHEKEDYETSFRYYEQAANAGNAEAQFMTAANYYFGMGTEQSYEKAMDYLNMAADQGDSNAQAWLAGLYFAGTGVEQSYEKAAEYYLEGYRYGSQDCKEAFLRLSRQT